jgi:hypothetical protein
MTDIQSQDYALMKTTVFDLAEGNLADKNPNMSRPKLDHSSLV